MIVHVPYGKDYTPSLQCCNCGKLFIYVGGIQNNALVSLDTRLIETQLRGY
ncbi:MAG: hypothetical protein Q8K48_03265 [Candidatus Planktophila sp.]|nr:hypothetical protein [Candidatus Planktophila sp.]